MINTTDVAVIGAGPYGLSLAAHLAVANVRHRVFGQPMQFWRTAMPEGMVLKSEGFASNLWHPNDALTLKHFCAERGLPYRDSGMPVPLEIFCEYGMTFQTRLVPMLDQRSVTRVDKDGSGFTLQLHDGETVSARRVVIATGIGSFCFVPGELDAIAGPLCTHSTDHHSLDSLAGKAVLVIGGGASGVEMAGLMSQKGSRVIVLTRQDRVAFCGPPHRRTLLEKIHAPGSGLGTGWRSLACVLAPMVFYHMPRGFRHMVVRNHLGPAPGWTSRTEIERNVKVTLSAELVRSSIENGRPQVEFVLPDGMHETIEADHVIAATGFRVDMRRLDFLSPQLLGQMELAEQTPVLSPNFETSVPNLFTIGVMAANSFGPLLRFAYGAGFASKRLSRHLVRTSLQQAVRAQPELATA